MQDSNKKNETVNPPKRGRGRPRKQPADATNQAPVGSEKKTSTKSKSKKPDKMGTLDGHFNGTDKTGEIDRRSPELQFSDLARTGKLGVTLAAERAGSALLTYAWDESLNFWRCLDTETDNDTDPLDFYAQSWLDDNHPKKSTPAKVEACAKHALRRLGISNKLPKRARNSGTLIPCSDVYLEITDAGIFAVEVDKKHGMTHSVPVACGIQPGQQYMPKPVPADSRFGRFLNEMQPETDMQDYLQELCGRTLLGICSRRAVWMIGDGKNGKSTIVDILKWFHKCWAVSDLHELTDGFGLENILGASLVICDEVAKKGGWGESRFKTLIGWNSIRVNRKTKVALNTSVRAHWFISSNQLPIITDNSKGVWDRIDFVPWSQEVKKKNPQLAEEVCEFEASIVLDWLLEGALRAVKRLAPDAIEKEPQQPRACRDLFNSARKFSNSARAWIDEENIFILLPNEDGTPNLLRTKREVYEHYQRWCEESQSAEAMKPEKFWQNLKSFPDFKGLVEEQVQRQGKRERFVNISK